MLTKSHNKYFDLYTITNEVTGPRLLIIAGIHGDEGEPILVASSLAKKLKEKTIKGKVNIIPVANISAFERGSRCGSDQKDLARTFPGSDKGTVTQKTASAISKLIKEADYLIDLHTGGALLDILPLTGYLLHPKKEILAKQQEMAKAFNLPLIWGTDAKVEGRTLSVARDYNVPAIYAECRGGVIINKKTIRLYEQGCLNVLESLGMICSEFKQNQNLFTWLEDYRSGEGHLQSKLPSPQNGIFIPSVPIGKEVKKGSLLGHVVNPVLNTKTKIISNEDGLLFMLRISSRVNTGDSLGGILPLPSQFKKVIYAK
ncbi:MAG: succinylglutamate desuccinylase/aspartoacylase family protein [Ginsengibacter sp.]